MESAVAPGASLDFHPAAGVAPAKAVGRLAARSEGRDTSDLDAQPESTPGRAMRSARGMAAWLLGGKSADDDGTPPASPEETSGPAPHVTAARALDERLAQLRASRRTATNADKDRIVEFINRQRLPYGLIPPPPEAPGSVDSDLMEIGRNYDGAHGEFIVVENAKGEIVGTAAFTPLREGVVELRKVYLDPSIRGGTGWLMVKYLIELARARGYRRMELETITSMKEAVKLYLRLGFKRTERPEQHAGVDLAFYLDLI